ncbi:MAG: hypothetical protein ACYC27_14205 [Armatimonadota bacterium]
MKLVLIFICTIIASFSIVYSQTEDTPVSPEQIRVTADVQEYYYDAQRFIAEGGARVTRGNEILSADRISGDVMTGDLQASGNVRYESPERTITGNSFVYNYQTKQGLVQEAAANQDNLFFKGQEIKAEPGRYTLIGSTFTTCGFEKPHYYLSAKELIIEPGKQLIARGVSIYLLNNKLLTIPKYRVDLTEGVQSKGKLPKIGYSEQYGFHTAYDFDLIHDEENDGSLDMRLSSRQTFQGGIKFDRIADKPIFARLTYREPAYGGAERDTVLSRLPEIGMRFYSDPALQIRRVDREPLYLSRQLIDPLSPVSKPGKVHIISEVSLGRFVEKPNGTGTERAEARTVAVMEPIPIGANTSISPGAALRLSAYGNGDIYGLLGARLAVGRRISPTSSASLTYITHAVSGDTPFSFDRLEIRNELAGSINFMISDIKVGIRQRYDLHRSDIFDTEITLAKTFHCLEPSITWRDRFDEISFNIGITGF